MTRTARAVWLAVAMAAATPGPAGAHRLDEYLQATRIDLRGDGVFLELRLTPGVALAGTVLSALDADASGDIDRREQTLYAARVLRDLHLMVDGQATPLSLSRLQFPGSAALRDGTGVIRLSAIGVTPIGAGRHRVEYVNRHRPENSVYLANALTPIVPGVVVESQQRDERQRTMTITYAVSGAPGRVGWLLAAMATVLGLVAGRNKTWRRRRRPPPRPTAGLETS